MKYIKDDEFIRGNPPMTKEEVRILSIAKLELEGNHTFLDIGAGTGSVSIQAAKICTEGKVVSIERDLEALDILYKNKDKFKADNLNIIKGDAIEVKDSINDCFDRIFIGGSGGSIEDIIREYENKLKHDGIVVLNFITIDNLYRAMKTLEKLNYETECTQVSISKAKGRALMLAANNPIFIVSVKKAVK